MYYLWPALLVAWTLRVALAAPEAVGAATAWSAGLAAATAAFCIEQAAGLALFAVVWAGVGPGRRIDWARRLPVVGLPVLGMLALFLLRRGVRSPAEALLAPADILRNANQVVGGMLIANSSAGLMLGGWMSQRALLAWCGAATGVGAFAVCWMRAGDRGRTLLLAWISLWLPALLFAPQSSRYWYLPAIPAAVGICVLLRALAMRLTANERWSAGLVVGGAVAGWVLVGAVAMGLRVPDWTRADDITRGVLADAWRTVQERPELERLVVADVPDGVGSGLWPAYVFNNGLAEALRLRARDAGTAGWAGEVRMLPGPHRPWPPGSTGVGNAGLPTATLTAALLRERTAVLVYDPTRPGLVAWPFGGRE